MAKNDSSISIWLPFTALAILLFANNWGIPLWNADEAAYAGFAHRMNATGDYLTQDFFWSEIHRKPPLHLWLTALSMKIFGSTEWAVRFFSSLLTLAGAYLIYQWLLTRFSQRIALLSALVFGSNLLSLALGKIGFTDATLLFFQLCAGIGLFETINRSNNQRFIWLFWTGIALGMLTKGPQILIPFSVLILALTISNYDRRIILKLQPWLYLPISLIPIFLWGFMSWQVDDGEFISWMIDWYILRRVGGSVLGQSGPPGYFFIVFLVAMVPFLMAWFGVLRKIVLRNFNLKTFEGFLILWLLAAWLPFEFIPSKLPSYAAGALPPMAILVALSLHSLNHKAWTNTWTKLFATGQLVITSIIAASLIYAIQSEFGFFGLFVALLTGLVPVVSSILYMLRMERPDVQNNDLWLCGSAILFGLMLVLPMMNVIKPILECPRNIASQIGFEIQKEDRILLAKKEQHLISLPFYLEQEGQVEEVWGLDAATYKMQSGDYAAILGDSLLAEKAGEKYDVTKFDCLDINSSEPKAFFIMIRK